MVDINIEVRKTRKAIDLLSLDDIDKLSRETMSHVVSNLRDVAKKRYNNLEKNQLFSPAYFRMEREKQVLGSVRGKSRNELIHDYNVLKKFLTEDKTSTVAGARAYERSKVAISGLEDKDKQRLFWEVKDKFAKNNPDLWGFGSLKSGEILEELKEIMSDTEAIDWDNPNVGEQVLENLKDQIEKVEADLNREVEEELDDAFSITKWG